MKKRSISALTLLTAALLMKAAYGNDDKTTCDMSKLPIGKESNCEAYLADDRELNKAYKALRKSLSQADANILKESQREWIKHRDELCQRLEKKNLETCSVYNASCENMVLDDCVFQLTYSRTLDLKKFLANPNIGIATKFIHSKTRFDDDNKSKNLSPSISSPTEAKPNK